MQHGRPREGAHAVGNGDGGTDPVEEGAHLGEVGPAEGGVVLVDPGAEARALDGVDHEEGRVAVEAVALDRDDGAVAQGLQRAHGGLDAAVLPGRHRRQALEHDGGVAALGVEGVGALPEAPPVALAHALESVEGHRGHRGGGHSFTPGGGRAIARGATPCAQPIAVMVTRRPWGAWRCSQRKIPCQVPRSQRPSTIGSVSDEPVSTERTCAGMSSSPSSACA